MTIKEHPTSLEKAADFLRQQIKSGVWKAGTKIPAYRTLARQAGVGIIIMGRAFKLLQEEKLLFSVAKVGTFVGDSSIKSAFSSHPEPTGLKWQQTKEKIFKDILNNKFHGSDYLPSSKELVSEYDVDIRTIKKSINALVNEHVLIPSRSRYRIQLFNSEKRQPKTLYFILSSHYLDNELWAFDKEVLNEFIRSLEKECVTKNIRLITHPFGEPFPDTVQTCASLGCIVWHSQNCNGKMDFVPYLHNIFKYAAIFIELSSERDSIFEIVKEYSQWKNFFISDQSMQKKAGLKMGKFLFEKGYSNIVFLDHMSHSQGLKDLYEGIKETYSSFNQIDAVTVLILRNFTEQDLKTNIRTNDILFENSISGQLEIIDSSRAALLAKLDPPYNHRADIHLQEVRFARHGLAVYIPLFRKALLYTTPRTAWICSDVNIAVNGALIFLKREGFDIPQKIGLAAFGDHFESFFHELTTFHLDFAGMARKMLNLIVYPEYAKKMFCIKGTNVFEVDGMVIDRGSA